MTHEEEKNIWLIEEGFKDAAINLGVTLLEDMKGPSEMRPEGQFEVVSRALKTPDGPRSSFFSQFMESFLTYRPRYVAFHSAKTYRVAGKDGLAETAYMIRYGAIY